MSFDYLMSVSMCMRNFISVQEIGLFSLFQNFWSSAKPRPMKNVISQSLGLDLVNINVDAKVYQNIPLSSRDRAIFTFLRIWTSAKPRSIPNVIWQSHGLHLVNIPMCMQNFITIFNSVQEIGPFHFFRIWSSVKPRPMKNDISQSLVLDLDNINVYTEVYQYIPLSSRDKAIFSFSEFGARQSLDRW